MPLSVMSVYLSLMYVEEQCILLQAPSKEEYALEFKFVTVILLRQ